MTSILLADDHKIFAEGIRFLLSYVTGYNVVGSVHTGKEALSFLDQQHADILLLDIDLPDMSGFDVMQILQGRQTGTRILALSMHDDIHTVDRMIQAGASGYCVKSAGSDELFNALTTVTGGNIYIPPQYLQQRIREKRNSDRNPLSTRETSIMRLICAGQTTNQIARQLCLSTRTIETHRKNIYRKLAVHSNVDLAYYAHTHRLVC